MLNTIQNSDISTTMALKTGNTSLTAETLQFYKNYSDVSWSGDINRQNNKFKPKYNITYLSHCFICTCAHHDNDTANQWAFIQNSQARHNLWVSLTGRSPLNGVWKVNKTYNKNKIKNVYIYQGVGEYKKNALSILHSDWQCPVDDNVNLVCDRAAD